MSHAAVARPLARRLNVLCYIGSMEPGGAERQVVEILKHLDRSCFATMLGGPDRSTLFMLTAEWRGTEGVEATGRGSYCEFVVRRFDDRLPEPRYERSPWTVRSGGGHL